MEILIFGEVVTGGDLILFLALCLSLTIFCSTLHVNLSTLHCASSELLRLDCSCPFT